MAGNIKIWSCEEEFKIKFTLEGPMEEITFLEWHTKGNAIVCGSKDMSVWMFSAEDGEMM